MALVYKDRVKCTTTTTGTGTYTFGAAVAGYQSFSTLTDNDTCFYTVENGTDWEVNRGTKSSSTLTRGTLIASSTGSAISWSAGAKNIFLSPPSTVFANMATVHVYSQDDMPLPTVLSGFTLPVIVPTPDTVYVFHDYITFTNPIHWGNALLTTPEPLDNWVYGINYIGATDAALVGDTTQTYKDGYMENMFVSFSNAGGKLFKQSATGVTSLSMKNCYRDGSVNPTVSPAAIKDGRIYIDQGGDNSNAYWVFTESGAGNTKLTIKNYDSKDFEPYYSTYTPYFDLTAVSGAVVLTENNRFNVADAKFILKASNDATFSAQSLALNNYLDTASNGSGGFETGIDYTSKTLLHLANRNIANANPEATLSWSSNATATTNSGAGTYVKVAGTTGLTSVSAFWDNNSGTNNSIRFLGKNGTPATLEIFGGQFKRNTGSAYTNLVLGLSINGATPTKLATNPIFNTQAAICGVIIETTLNTNDIIDLRGAGTVDWVGVDCYVRVRAHA